MAAAVRFRADEDIEECVRLLAATHASDRYPLIWPADAASWLSPRDLLAAWVTEENGVLLGHVALQRTGRDSSPVLLDSSGIPVEEIAAVTRLFVSPAARRRGLGSALLETACEHAANLGLQPALEVVDTDRFAIALYERAGWVRASSRDWALPDGSVALLHYYVSPNQVLAPGRGA